jgi:hypothetical protein
MGLGSMVIISNGRQEKSAIITTCEFSMHVANPETAKHRDRYEWSSIHSTMDSTVSVPTWISTTVLNIVSQGRHYSNTSRNQQDARDLFKLHKRPTYVNCTRISLICIRNQAAPRVSQTGAKKELKESGRNFTNAQPMWIVHVIY